MIELDKDLEAFLQKPMKLNSIADADKIVRERVARLRIFVETGSSSIAPKFARAVTLTEVGHKACEGMCQLSKHTLSYWSLFTSDKQVILRVASLRLDRPSEATGPDDDDGMPMLSPDMIAEVRQTNREIRKQLIDAVTNKVNQGKTVGEMVDELFKSDEVKLLAAKLQGALLVGAVDNIKFALTAAVGTSVVGLIYRWMFYQLILGDIGGGLDRGVFSEKINEAIGEIPPLVISVVPVVGDFVDALKTMYRFYEAFRNTDTGLADLAKRIKDAEEYITAYTSMLDVWSINFAKLMKIANKVLSELNNDLIELNRAQAGDL
jgi:hypothetical protein